MPSKDTSVPSPLSAAAFLQSQDPLWSLAGRSPAVRHGVVCYPWGPTGPSEEKNAIKVSVLYPNTAGGKFDLNYFLNQHMPMVQQKFDCRTKVGDGINLGTETAVVAATYTIDIASEFPSGIAAPRICSMRS